MSSLKEALKPKASSSKNSSSRNPAYYSKEKNLFITDMATNPDEVVRIAAAGNDHIPTGTLKTMLSTETDNDVLKVILMNDRTPLKAVTTFADDERAAFFDDDEEVTNHLKARMDAAGGGSDITDED